MLIRIFSTLFVALSLSAQPFAKPADAGLDAAHLARIPQRLREFVDKGTAAGFVTLVARHGKIAALEATGYTDLETRQPMKTNNIFQLHSMTKPVVCMAAMMLAEQGKLHVDDPVEIHLPEFRGQWAIQTKNPDGSVVLQKVNRKVTLRDLMTHTSGMISDPPPAIGELHGALHKSLADVVLVESQQPLLFQPGTKWSYSNAGIASLARVVEVVSGMPYEKFLEAKIFKPLGMLDTHTFPPKEKWNRMPTAYILKDGKPLKYTADPLGEGKMKFRDGAKYPLPEGGLYSTASDLFRLYQLFLNGGEWNGVRLLTRASVDEMTRVQTGSLKTSTPGAGWGLGWFVMQADSNLLMPPGTFGHGGRYGTFCFIDRKHDLIGIFMIHREGGSEERVAFVEEAVASVLQ